MNSFDEISSPPQAAAEVLVNQNFAVLDAFGVYANDYKTTNGLTWGYLGGRYGAYAVAAGMLNLTASATNHVVVERATGVISAAVDSTDWDDTVGYGRVYLLVTGAAAVTTVEDHRVGAGGIHGGGAAASSGSGGAGDGASTSDWSDDVVSTAPNDAVPVVSWLPSNAAAAVDAVVGPKGLGSLAAQVANASTSGGNKRGEYAVDWQVRRSSASQVASGAGSFVAGGYANTASGQWSFAGGKANVANGDFSEATGYGAFAHGIPGARVRASGFFGGAGDCQAGEYVVLGQTSDATPLNLAIDGGANAGTDIAMPNYTAWLIEALVLGRQTNAAEHMGIRIQAIVKRATSPASVQLVGTPMVSVVAASSGASSWTGTIVANTVAGGMSVQVTGAAGTNIYWGARVKTMEIQC